LPINIPNILTVLRILIAPLFVIFLLKGMTQFALLAFALAGISDGLDGLIARYFDQRTTLGSYLDPIADKLLLTSAFVSLAVFKFIPGWLAVIVISRDVVIMIGFAIFSINNIVVKIKPSLVGKCTTVIQLATVFLVLLDPKIIGAFYMKWSLFWSVAVSTILSGLHYMYVGLNILQEDVKNNQGKK